MPKREKRIKPKAHTDSKNGLKSPKNISPTVKVSMFTNCFTLISFKLCYKYLQLATLVVTPS